MTILDMTITVFINSIGGDPVYYGLFSFVFIIGIGIVFFKITT